jgi:hypothetical protein
MKVIRNIVAVLVGLVAATLVVMMADQMSHIIHPPPSHLNFNDKEAFEKYMQNVPVQAFMVMMAGWILSSFAGGLVTTLIQTEKKIWLALITGGILMAGALANQFMIPHPGWMMVCTLVFYIPSAYLGGKTGISIFKKSAQNE